MELRVSSFNCRGISSSIGDLNILAKSYDVICLQETWQMQDDLASLNNTVSGMHGCGVSAMDPSAGLN